MSDWPKVWLIFATYKRTNIALATIESLRRYLIYPNLHWHVADDGSGETDDGTNRWHVGVLVDKIAEFYPEVTYHEMSTPPGQYNTGGNINKAIHAARANGCLIHMLNFDDWVLLQQLDICPMVDVLDVHESVGFIRLSYMMPGLAGLTVRYDAPRANRNWIWYRLIRDWTLSNPWKSDRYMVSTQPYVAHYRFFQSYGMHPENIAPGEAEIGMGNQYINSALGEDGPQILFSIGPRMAHSPWGHTALRSNYYAAQYGIMHS